MSEVAEILRRESAPEILWKQDSKLSFLNDEKSELNSKLDSSKEVTGHCSSHCSGEKCDDSIKLRSLSDCSKDKDPSKDESCTDGKNCTCKCSDVKRRCSTSDIKSFNALEYLSNAAALSTLKKNSLGGGGSRSGDKIEKINLANLVFNPNFKSSSGCVNLPVIRAGQNLAQKNAQRTTNAKDLIKEANTGGSLSSKDVSQLTQQAALDLIAQQLQQPQSLDKLTQKLQQLSLQQRKNKDPDSTDDAAAALAAAVKTTQNNILRYKTELCRSYEEGGECRFGSACTFAHGPEELRPVPRHPLYKTELCRTYHQHGYCQYGTRCHFIHDPEEADKNAPLKGCKTWGRHDKLSSALLSLASSTGLLDEKSSGNNADNDVLLTNLRRLHALRMMTGQERTDQSAQFSLSQPMAQQLSMAHQQLTSAGINSHLPLSMTQPLPADVLQMGLQRPAHLPPHARRPYNRIDNIASDYASWGLTPPPPSPTYSGISPFGGYHQQFSPLPHHPSAAQTSYPHPYAFSATAPDLSSALNMSPYSISPQNFSSTVNVGHFLQDPKNPGAAFGQNLTHGNVQIATTASSANDTNSGSTNASSSGSNQSQSSRHDTVNGSHSTGLGMQQSLWQPPTNDEVASSIDKQLFGFGLDSQQGSGGYSMPQQYYPYYQSMAQPYAGYQSVMPVPEQKYVRGETDLLSLLHGSAPASEKYVSGSADGRPDDKEQSVRPKSKK